MEKISGIDVLEHENSKRILNIRLNDEIIEKLIFLFNHQIARDKDFIEYLIVRGNKPVG